jgi:hypothetical protein
MEDDPQLPDWVHNLREDDSGLPRVLGEGLHAEIFPGSNSMLSIVSIDLHSEGDLPSYPEEQGEYYSRESAYVFKIAKKSTSRQATSGTSPRASATSSRLSKRWGRNGSASSSTTYVTVKSDSTNSSAQRARAPTHSRVCLMIWRRKGSSRTERSSNRRSQATTP